MTMRQVMEISFWLCAVGIGYTYVLYPLLLVCAVRLRARPVKRGAFAGSVSFVVSAHNEERRIARRRDELAAMLQISNRAGEVIIVSDGSTDGTAAAAREGAGSQVRVIELKQNVGKAEALNLACASATTDVIIFADARQTWAEDALQRLLENFADDAVGGVSGDLRLEAPAGSNAGVGVYWRYEKAIRRLETRIHSSVGATGAISGVRRHLFRPIPPRTILDDVFWPLQVVMQGYRVIHDERAHAMDRLPEKPRDEFRRKVRTLSGNFQLVMRAPGVLVPWRNPIWFQFWSHKLMRLAAPWMLLVMLGTSIALPGMVYRAVLACEVLGYLLALLGMSRQIASRARLASAASSFVVLNTAAWVAFWVWISGRAAGSWNKTVYAPASGTAVGGGDQTR